MKPTRRERRHTLLRVFAAPQLNDAIKRRINDGPRLTSMKGLDADERKYYALVLRASTHAGTMTPGERAAYRQARHSHRAMLARRKRLR